MPLRYQMYGGKLRRLPVSEKKTAGGAYFPFPCYNTFAARLAPGRPSPSPGKEKTMKRILFVCHGNICRSPMGEFIFKDLVRQAGLEDQFEVQSAATSREELGNPVYPPARRELGKHGIDCAGKTARQLTREDYRRFDLLIGMDRANLWNMQRLFGGDPHQKLHLLMDFTCRPGEVADPWYSGDFSTAWKDILEGCQGLLAHLTGEEG